MAAALAAAMLASAVAAPAFAAGSNTMQYYYDEVSGGYKTQTNDESPVDTNNTTNPNLTTSGTTKVKYEVHTSYEWSIPSVIDFGSDAGVGKTVTVNAIEKDDTNTTPAQGADVHGKAMQVKVTKNVLEYGKSLFIKIETPEESYESTGTVGIKQPGFFVVSKEGKRLYYTITTTNDLGEPSTDGEAVVGRNTKPIMEVWAGANTESRGLIFELKTENGRDTEFAGTYVNTLTFTAKIGKSSF